MGTLSAQFVDVFGLENIAFGAGLGCFSLGMSVVILQPVAGNNNMLRLIAIRPGAD